MQTTQISPVSFNARFLYSKDLEQIANYAIEHNRAQRLNQASKNIDSSYVQTKILVNIGETTGGYPTVEFVRYAPRKSVPFPQNENDYNISRPIVFTSGKHVNPLKFALERIIKMGNDVPNNSIFKRVVVDGK